MFWLSSTNKDTIITMLGKGVQRYPKIIFVGAMQQNISNCTASIIKFTQFYKHQDVAS